MKLKKRIASLFLACVMAVGLLVVPAGASGSSPESTGRADKLASLGLFQGTGSGYQLDGDTTRIQGLVMLLRLLGLEEEALAYAQPSHFTDVGWGDNYVSYAYDNGLTNGTSAATFSPNDPLNANGYVTFLLRAMGYSDAEGDFSWADALSFAVELSIMDAASANALKSVSMNRGDMVDLSYAALTCEVKGSSRTLAERLVSDGVFTRTQGRDAGVIGSGSGWVYTYDSGEEDEGGSAAASDAVAYRQQAMAGVGAVGTFGAIPAQEAEVGIDIRQTD